MQRSEFLTYAKVAHHLRTGHRPQTSLQKKTGETLADITPYKVLSRPDNVGAPEWWLYYLDSQGQAARILIDELAGLSILTEDEEPRVQFTYYKENALEDAPRQLQASETNVHYGVHPLHAKLAEKPDFYVKGPDTQYADPNHPKYAPDPAQRARQFPFWRVAGLVGEPETLREQMVDQDAPDVQIAQLVEQAVQRAKQTLRDEGKGYHQLRRLQQDLSQKLSQESTSDYHYHLRLLAATELLDELDAAR